MPGSLRVSVNKLSCAVGAVESPHARIKLGLQSARTAINRIETKEVAAPKLNTSEIDYVLFKLNAPNDRFLIIVRTGSGPDSPILGTAHIKLQHSLRVSAVGPSLLEQAYLADDDMDVSVDVVDDANQVMGQLGITLKYFLEGEEEAKLDHSLDVRWKALQGGNIADVAETEATALSGASRTKKIKQKIRDGLASFMDALGSLST